MHISIIAAIGPNRELGKDNKLLWHIQEDLARFKKLTQGHAVIMGRKTYESIGKPLPNRTNIIITRDPTFQASNCLIFHSFEDVIKFIKKPTTNHQSLITKNEVFIIGGGQVYQQAFPYADKLYLTLVEGKYDADTFFPDYSTFRRVIHREMRTSNDYTYTFLEIEK